MRKLAAAAVVSTIACNPATGPALNEPEPPQTQSASADWASLTPMPEARWAVGAAAVDGTVYVVGGAAQVGGPAATKIFAYDPPSDEWRSSGALIHPVREPGAAALDGRIYVIGGFDPEGSVPYLQVLDPATGQIEAGPPLPTPRGNVAVAVVDGRVHAIGGLFWRADDPFGDYWVPSHDVFDPATGAWSSRKAPTLSHRTGYVAASVGGRIYLLPRGGERVMEVYDPDTDSWTSRDAPAGRDGAAAVAVAGKVYVLGGGQYQNDCCGGPVPSSVVDRFDPQAGTWDQVASLPRGRTGHGAAVVGQSIYVVGGSLTGPYLSASSLNQRYTIK